MAIDKIFDPQYPPNDLKVYDFVWVNGCFDLLHIGHIRFLQEAWKYGTLFVVGVNSDESVKRLKGSGRPINILQDRMEVLAALEMVDYVTWFQEDNPCEIIRRLKPRCVIKAGYTRDQMPEVQVVEEYGGETVILPLVEGYSTTSILTRGAL